MTGSELQLSSAQYTSSSLLPYTAGPSVNDGDTPWNTYGQMVWSGSALSRDFVSGTYHMWKKEAEVMWFSSYNHDCLSLAVAVLYYYHYKRSVLRISDPRFYEDFNWVNHQHDGSWDPNLRYTHTHIHMYKCVCIDWFGLLVTKNLVSFFVLVLGTENAWILISLKRFCRKFADAFVFDPHID